MHSGIFTSEKKVLGALFSYYLLPSSELPTCFCCQSTEVAKSLPTHCECLQIYSYWLYSLSQGGITVRIINNSQSYTPIHFGLLTITIQCTLTSYIYFWLYSLCCRKLFIISFEFAYSLTDPVDSVDIFWCGEQSFYLC